LKTTKPIRIFNAYANRIRDRLVPLRKTEIDGIKFYFSRGNEPQDPSVMGRTREMHQALDAMVGDTAIDVGAHIGSYTLRMAKRFRHVIAFEPNPFNRHILGLNLQLNRTGNVRVEEVALSDRDQISPFFLHRAADGTGSLDRFHYGFKYDKMVQVNVKRLDDFEFESVDVLKIDAEGSELPILRGATRTIERFSPILAIEIHNARSSTDASCLCEACSFLRDSAYNPRLLGDYTTTPVHWVLATPTSPKNGVENH
jgi:FkbM family methyltransferase